MPGFLDTYLPYLLQRADHLMSARFHSSLQEAGIEVSEWRVLAVLSVHPSMSLQAVADVALLPQPTASHACRRLETDGLVSRRRNERDRRASVLELTDDGAAMVSRLKQQAAMFESDQLSGSSIDVDGLTSTLQALIEGLEQPN